MNSAADNDDKILADMREQEGWVRDLSVKNASLKFRLPYDSRKYNELSYIGGIIQLPVWGPQSTTESRLITNADTDSKVYDVLSYNERMYYFNTITRSNSYHTSDIAEFPASDSVAGFCYDCVAEFRILLKLLNVILPEYAMNARWLETIQQIGTVMSDKLLIFGGSRAQSLEPRLISSLSDSDILNSLQIMSDDLGESSDDTEAEAMRLMGFPPSFKQKRNKF